MFPLAAGGGVAEDIFGWPAVVDSANVWGYTSSVAMAGIAADQAMVLERSLTYRAVQRPFTGRAKRRSPLMSKRFPYRPPLLPQ